MTVRGVDSHPPSLSPGGYKRPQKSPLFIILIIRIPIILLFSHAFCQCSLEASGSMVAVYHYCHLNIYEWACFLISLEAIKGCKSHIVRKYIKSFYFPPHPLSFSLCSFVLLSPPFFISYLSKPVEVVEHILVLQLTRPFTSISCWVKRSRFLFPPGIRERREALLHSVQR